MSYSGGSTYSENTPWQRRNFRISDNSNARNTDLNYRPAPVISDYDIPSLQNDRAYRDGLDRYKSRSDPYNYYKGYESGYFRNNDPNVDDRPNPFHKQGLFSNQHHESPGEQTPLPDRKREMASDKNELFTRRLPGSGLLPFPPVSKRFKEDSVKISYSQRFKAACPDITDDSLPQELKLMFQPLFCKLCSMQLSSNSMARLHYKSKNHEKKIKAWLVERSKETGEPLHPRATAPTHKNKEENDPKHFYCDVCDLPLTGRLHAESHYMGKAHHRALQGGSPQGKGCFNVEGQWVRTIKPDVAHSDGFGSNFGLPNEFASKRSKFSCDTCNAVMTSAQQLSMHLNGIKHQKKLKQLELMNMMKDGNAVKRPVEHQAMSENSKGSSGGETSRNLVEYRTPSGHFYCEPCNLTLNSEVQFNQHLGSKKHRKKAAPVSK